MKLSWTQKALSDLDRLYEFLSPANKTAAAKAIQALVVAPQVLLQNPRIGEPLEEFSPQEVRRLLVSRIACSAKRLTRNNRCKNSEGVSYGSRV